MSEHLPNFLISGVPKAGTSSMHTCLRGHPEIYLPERKELHYFTHDLLGRNMAGPGDRRTWERTVATFDEYRSYYADADGRKIVGESSPSYAYFHSIIPDLKRTLGEELRVLIMIRNPIRRAHSNYIHLVSSGRETLSFHDAVLAEPERKRQGYGDFWRYAEHGLYSAPIAAYRDAFGSGRIKVIQLEEFQRDPRGQLAEILGWLGVDPAYRPAGLGVAYGHTGRARSEGIKQALAGAARVAVRLKRLVPRSFYTRAKVLNATVNRWNTSREEFPIEDRTWERLAEFFRDDLRRTGELLGRDLSWWLERKPAAVQP